MADLAFALSAQNQRESKALTPLIVTLLIALIGAHIQINLIAEWFCMIKVDLARNRASNN